MSGSTIKFEYTCGLTKERVIIQKTLLPVITSIKQISYYGGNMDKFGKFKCDCVYDFGSTIYNICEDCEDIITQCHINSESEMTDVEIHGCKFILLMIDNEYKYITDHDGTENNIDSIFDATKKPIKISNILKEYEYKPYGTEYFSNKLIINPILRDND